MSPLSMLRDWNSATQLLVCLGGTAAGYRGIYSYFFHSILLRYKLKKKGSWMKKDHRKKHNMNAYILDYRQWW